MVEAAALRKRTRIAWGQATLTGALALFLLLFLLLPIASVVFVAFQDLRTGAFTLVHFADFFSTALFREAFWNSIYAAGMSVIVASVIAIPLAYFTSRFNFAGTALIQSLGFIPLVMPPFVGAVAMQLIFGRNGSINLLLEQWFGFKIAFMEGLNGVIFVQSIHYFPFILINLSASLNNIDRAMEEAAQNLGAKGVRLFRRIVFPLAMPGYIAGAAIVFIKVLDDLGTPLLLNVTKMLAPQAYLRISSIGLTDPMGYVISVLLVVFSLGWLWVALLTTRGREYATVQRGGGGLLKRDLPRWEKVGCYAVILLILAVVLSPHLGLLLLSFGTVWSYAVLPDAYTLEHYREIVRVTPHFITNTVLYSGFAALLDVVIATAIAYIVQRTKMIGRQWLDYIAMSAIATPGLVLGIGYLRTFHAIEVPLTNEPLATWWVLLIVALSVRRLPYALRACSAGLQQVSIALEESALNLGATRMRTIRRIVVPLMAGAILAGFVTSFATAAVELSTTIMLVASDANAPLSYGIYIEMQSAAGRGAGAALGIVAVAIVAVGTYVSHRVIAGGRRAEEIVSA